MGFIDAFTNCVRLRRHMNKFSLGLFIRFTTTNQRCLALNKSRDKLRSLLSEFGSRQIIYLLRWSANDRQMIGKWSWFVVSKAKVYRVVLLGKWPWLVVKKRKKSPSCVARQMAMICGHQSKKSPSCVAPQMAIICGNQSKSEPSCVARQMAVICGEKGNIPGASGTN